MSLPWSKPSVDSGLAEAARHDGTTLGRAKAGTFWPESQRAMSGLVAFSADIVGVSSDSTRLLSWRPSRRLVSFGASCRARAPCPAARDCPSFRTCAEWVAIFNWPRPIIRSRWPLPKHTKIRARVCQRATTLRNLSVTFDRRQSILERSFDCTFRARYNNQAGRCCASKSGHVTFIKVDGRVT